MGSSLRIFRIRGIDVRMHLTFPLILVWAALQFGYLNGQGLQGALVGVVVTLLLFSIVVLHELGHSFAALHYGIGVKQIVLLPIGGVAELERIPERPSHEFSIAIAGPLVNFGLAILMAGLGFILNFDLGLNGIRSLAQGLSDPNFELVFRYLFLSNLFLGVFNLLPAFPMDGGRVLRSLLASRIEYGRATRIAVVIGQGAAWLLGLWGFLGGGFFVIIIAVFIFMGAGQERQMVRLRDVLGRLSVSQAYSKQVRWLDPQSSLREAVALTLETFQADFPVCAEGELVGLLTHKGLIEALDKHNPSTTVDQVMLTGIQPVDPGDGLFIVQQRLTDSKVDALPVVEDGQFLGLITSRDLNEVYRLSLGRPELLAPLQSI
jgi:Zn-dependent protease/CBS domain-containing protein